MSTASENGVIKFWDMEKFNNISTSPAHHDPSSVFKKLIFSPNGDLCYAASNRNLKVFEWEPMICHDTVEIPWSNLFDLYVDSIDNHLIAASSNDNFINLWSANLALMKPVSTQYNKFTSQPGQMNEASSTYSSSQFPSREHPVPRTPPFDVRPNISNDTRSSPLPPIRSRNNTQITLEDNNSDSSLSLKHSLRTNRSNSRQLDNFPEENFKSITPTISKQFSRQTSLEMPSTTSRGEIVKDLLNHPPVYPNEVSSREIQHTSHYSLYDPIKPIQGKNDYVLLQRENIALIPIEQGAVFQVNQLESRMANLYVDSDAKPEIQSTLPNLSKNNASIHSLSSPFIPSVGKTAVDLDFSIFLSGPLKSQSSLVSSTKLNDLNRQTSTLDVLDFMSQGNSTILAILSSRLRELRPLRSTWDDADPKTCFQQASQTVQDHAVWVDLFRVVSNQPKLFTLDLCVQVLPLVKEILFDVYEDYIRLACTMIRIILRHFGDLISETLFSVKLPSPGVDFSREERIHKCQSCYDDLMVVQAQLSEMTQTPNELGVLIRDTLGDFSKIRNQR